MTNTLTHHPHPGLCASPKPQSDSLVFFTYSAVGLSLKNYRADELQCNAPAAGSGITAGHVRLLRDVDYAALLSTQKLDILTFVRPRITTPAPLDAFTATDLTPLMTLNANFGLTTLVKVNPGPK